MAKRISQEKHAKEFTAVAILIFAILLFFIQYGATALFYDFYGNAFLVALCLLFLLG